MAAMTRLSLTLDPMGFSSLFLKFQPMRTHYGPWQPCWISNQHQKHKSGRGPSSEHFWQVWLISVTAENWSYTSYLFFTPERQIIVL
jgi:hypothetical protein